jgi:hypothetical protein
MTDHRLRLAATGLLIVGVWSGTASLQSPGTPPANRRNFVACPIVRDTSTLPCWLAEYDGELYYLGSQGSSGSAFYPPQLGHEALVEGTVSSGPRICGGIPLTPVRVSVMIEINRACNTVLPAEKGFAPAPSPLMPAASFPSTTREFSVPYDFDSDYLTLHTSRIALEAVRIAKLVNPSRIDVRGQRGATLLSNGRTLTEGPRIAEVRATNMGEHLAGLGVPADRVHVTWQKEPDTPDGVTDPQRRRVLITLVP